MGAFSDGKLLEGVTSTATAGGTTTLTVTSDQFQVFTGTLAQTVVLPDATTMKVGQSFDIKNESNGTVTVQFDDNSAFTTLAMGQSVKAVLTNNGTSNGTWAQLSGSASGGSGATVSFIEEDNHNFEATIGDWVAYADAAGDQPVDGTGGSPTVTFLRTTTASEVLRGDASAELVKDAANRQGEGFSLDVTIPQGYNYQNMDFSFVYNTTSGTYTSEALQVFVYDVTNTVLITPFNSKIQASSGKHIVTFPTSDSESYRVIVHVAGTDTTAYNVSFDDMELTPHKVVYGAAMSDWQSDGAITITGATTDPTKGTTADDELLWRRVGGDVELILNYKQTGAGANGSGVYEIALPSGLSLDTTRVQADQQIVGTCHVSTNADETSASTRVGIVRMTSSTTFSLFPYTSSGPNISQISSGGFQLGLTNVSYFAQIRVPIAGWSSNVQMADASTFRLAEKVSMTRVTGSAPTKLGEYRSYLRNASATTYTETNGDPAATPSVADGFLFYGTSVWASADPNNNPSRYEIFIGKNKQYKLQAYDSAGRTGFVGVGYYQDNTVVIGISESYDPTTGILSLSQPNNTAGTNGGRAGRDEVGNSINDVYFDIVISENVQAIGVAENNPKVSVYNSSTQTINNNADDLLEWDTVEYDTHSGFDLANEKYVVPVAGYYLVRVAVLMNFTGSTGSGPALLKVRKNGVDFKRIDQRPADTNDVTYTGSCTVSCVVGDEITVNFRNLIGTNETTTAGAAFTWMQIERTE